VSADPHAVQAHLRAHRSIRRFRDAPVPDEALERWLEAGLRASSSGNMQAWSVIVTRDASIRAALFDAHLQQGMLLEAGALLTFCADFHRMRRWLALNDAAPAFDDLFSFMVAAIDATLASQNVALAAEADGFGICYMGSTLASAGAIAKTLGCPEHVVPVVGFVVGVPAEDPPLRDRLPLSGVVHRERYTDPDDATLAAIYRERDVAGWNRYMANPELKARVEAAGVRHLAQIYSELKYTRASHHGFAEALLATLRECGFFTQG
jgi:nitroreductase